MMDTYGYARPEVTKHSHAEWLGEVPTDWDIKKMKYLFRDHSQKGQPDATLLSVTQGQGVVPRTWVENRMVMPSGNLESFKFIEKEDFAISLRSFEGGLEYCHHDGIISPAYTVLKRRHANLDSGYYRYLFKSYAFISELQTSVVGIREGKNISFEELSYSLMPIPPLSAQRAIAAFLDDKCAKIDGAVKIKEDQIALLRERRQIIIQDAVTRGLNPAAPMKDSGIDWIGQIPAHWEVKRNKHMFVEINERSAKGTEQHLSMSQKLGLVPANLVEKSLVSESYEGAKLVREGDLVLNRLKAHLAVFSIASMEGLVSPDYSVFRPFVAGASSRYYESLFKTSKYLGEFRLRVRGIVEGFYRLYTDSFMDIPLLIPPQFEQGEIIDHLDRLSAKFDDAISIKQDQIAALKEYKTSLINAAVTGKIKVI
ncbi:restriction endonuclease subunit S [Yoonia vestfoldensis]|jgi:type I restriction enzyme S subunit|uniref:restriction endonuclease subunit S n=1 Tax=Yoonia vestfoldensis TaxID=245188 RepID=UPI00037C9DA5|nr:restriction endonuclease subunit S [Yoonia vestfoldensis]